MTIIDDGVSATIEPSAGLTFKLSSAMRPPAPGRLSTMTVEA
jgi:hypothetical protein